MRIWARRLQVLAGLLVMVAPGLPWVRFPLLGHVVGLPGLLYHGGILLGLGMLSVIMGVGGARVPGVQAALSLLALGLIAHDGHSIVTRTEYELDRLQITLAENTGALSQLGVPLPRLAPTHWRPQEFVGSGLLLGGLGGVVLLLGAAGEIRSYMPQRDAVSVLLGLPRCAGCRGRLSLAMGFCPHCGQNLQDGHHCARCAEWCPGTWQFCARCGLKDATEPARE